MIGLSAACLLALVLSGKATNITVIAVSGDTAPAAGLDKVYTQFLNPVINEAGDVVYSAVVTNASAQQFRSLWMVSSGVQSLIGLQGENAPGTPALYLSFSDNRPSLNENGTVLFDAKLTGPGVISFENEKGLWIGQPGAVQKLIRSGDPAPTIPDVTISSVGLSLGQAHRLSPLGRTAFRTTLDGASVSIASDTALFNGSLGTLQLLAREGEPAPGTATGVVYDSLLSSTPYLNDAGMLAFQGEVRGFDFGVRDENDEIIWAGQLDTLGIAIRESDLATTNGTALAQLKPPVINSAGTLAFSSGLYSGSDETDTAIWLTNPLRLVAREGEVAPGTGGLTFGDFTTSDPFLNDRGHVVFNADLEGANVISSTDSAIYAGNANQLTLIAREGDQAPGFQDGVVFRELRFRTQLLNSAGQVVLYAEVIGTGINNNNNGAIWIADIGGPTRLLVRDGDSIEVAPGDVRTIREIRAFSGGGDGDGTTSSFNNAGRLVFVVVFRDFSWGLVSVQAAPLGTLSLELTGDDLVLSWEGDNFTLETAPTLNSPWTLAPDQSTPQILLPPATDLEQYFRLRSP